MSEQDEQIITLNQDEILEFCGQNDSRLRQIESRFHARIIPRGNEIRIQGAAEEVERAGRVIQELLEVHRSARTQTTKQQVRFAIDAVKNDRPEDIRAVFLDRIAVPLKGKRVSPLTAGQKRYVDAIRGNDIVLAVGPAGTGKTYLAVAMAVNHWMEGRARRIILVRPAVEAGERLGFLPGDIAAKFDPFVRPLYDALYDMMEMEKVASLLEQGTIEIAPLAFMRGRTLNSAFVILDEGQNTTAEQMKMFLTRLGADSKAVVTGDVTQIDLPRHKVSGLVHARKILEGIGGIAFVDFDERDVVRHELVQQIIRAYEQDVRERQAAEDAEAAADEDEDEER
ncbi:MAG: PhoH family protein [Candidatus Sumerlaeota bacterium]|nr:PhoH family protein [Candidatus Sumerlaeota bacterium]